MPNRTQTQEEQPQSEITHGIISEQIRGIKSDFERGFRIAVALFSIAVGGVATIWTQSVKHQEAIEHLRAVDAERANHESRISAMEATRFTANDAAKLSAEIASLRETLAGMRGSIQK